MTASNKHEREQQTSPAQHEPTQQSVPCMVMRGGTSKGVYFCKKDLPADKTEREAVLLKLMGSPHERQIDGLGGGSALTSKVALLSRSARAGIDLDYQFAQVQVTRPEIDYPTCINILSGAGLFAVTMGLVRARAPMTTLRIYDVNINSIIEQQLSTPGGEISWRGDTAIAGVAGTAAAITMYVSNMVGGKTGALYPSGRSIEELAGVRVSLVDVAMPCVYFLARDFGLTGGETKAELDGNQAVLERLLALRIQAGERMGIANVKKKVYPKMVLLSAAADNGDIRARYFTPYECHATYAASGGFSLAAASLAGDNLVSELMRSAPPHVSTQTATIHHSIKIEHPSGLLETEVTMNKGDWASLRGKVVRTARPLMLGRAYLP